MKRITLLMAAIICLATTAVAQISENQTLSTTLWKQGIATCAHYTAHARGFAKKIEEIKGKYPQGYTLDDLNEVYSNQGRKWEKIYNEFKKEEDKSGTINDLKELVTPQIWKLVEPEFQAFITEHPEAMQDVPAQPADKQAEGEQANGDEQNADAEMLPGPADLLDLIGEALRLLRRDEEGRAAVRALERLQIDRTNANLQEFSTDAADQMKALSIRLTGKAIRNNEAEPFMAEQTEEEETITEGLADDEQPEENPVLEEAPVAEDDENNVPLNLFMSRPDENDVFTRVSDTLEPGNSIYVLTTFDGTHGTFEVIDKPEVHRFALMMPAENLIRACSGNAIQIPSGNRIVTDRAGEAEFIDGHWHVVVKAIIHYEG